MRPTSGVRQAAPAYTWSKITEEYEEDGSPVFHGSILAGALGQNESGVDTTNIVKKIDNSILSSFVSLAIHLYAQDKPKFQ